MMNRLTTARTLLILAALTLALTVRPAFAQYDRILVNGDPPLMESTVYTVFSFWQWLAAGSLTEGDYALLRTHLRSEWLRGDVDTIEGVYAVYAAIPMLQQMSPVEREETRLMLLRSIVAAQPTAAPGRRQVPTIADEGRRSLNNERTIDTFLRSSSDAGQRIVNISR